LELAVAVPEFDHDRWPEELRALALARDETMDAYIDDATDERRDAFEGAADRFAAAHRAWLRENPGRIPGLIACRRREQRRPISYGTSVGNERVREAARREIEELWSLYWAAVREPGGQPDDASAPTARESNEPQRFTVVVTDPKRTFSLTYFGVFDTVEEAETVAAEWEQDSRAEGLAGVSFFVEEINSPSAYAAWISPERQRAAARRHAQNRAARQLLLLLEFHDDEAVRELAPRRIADAMTQSGAFEVTVPEETSTASYRHAVQAASRLVNKQLTVDEQRRADGQVVTVTIKTTINLTDYRSSHGRNPGGPGSWTLRHMETGEELILHGKWGDVRRSLPPGDWSLLA
jgi:hypothetical protein